MFPRKGIRAIQGELQAQQMRGVGINPRQQARLDELSGLQKQRPLNRQEIDLLREADVMKLRQAEDNRNLRDLQELNEFKRQQANGETIGNPARFEELLGAEKSRRESEKRNQMERTVNRGLGLAIPAAALGAGGVGAAAVMGGGSLFPFSLDYANGDVGELAKKAALIEREQEKRQFEDALAQETVAAQTQLANDLYARQQKGALDTQMMVAQKGALAGNTNGQSVDVVQKVDALAQSFVAQGIDPSVAVNRAIDIINMDGRSKGYL